MAHQLLLIGATGYIGGSFLHSLLTNPVPQLPKASIHVLVRSPAVAEKLSAAGIHTIIGGLDDQSTIEKAIKDLQIDVLVNTADAFHDVAAKFLIETLATRGTSDKELHYIHTSGTSVVCDHTGWKWPGVKDTEDIYALQKQVEQPYPIRTTDIAVAEAGEATGVKTYIVIPPTIYGRNSSPYSNPISIQFPQQIRATLKTGVAHYNTTPATARNIWPIIHIADLGTYYRSLLTAILAGKNPPSGAREGSYFAVTHHYRLDRASEAIAQAMKEMGLITSAELQNWASYEEAGPALGLPAGFVGIAYASHCEVQAVKGREKLGWEAEYGEEYLWSHFKEEVEYVLKNDRERGVREMKVKLAEH